MPVPGAYAGLLEGGQVMCETCGAELCQGECPECGGVPEAGAYGE